MTGGTGALGRDLVSAALALARGDEVRVLSRRAGAAVAEGASLAVADVLTGQGLARAFDGAEVVIYAATSPFRRAGAAEIEGTGRVVEAAEKAAAHLIYVSIVGVDRHRFPYYRAKLAAEQIVAAARNTWAIARATQFHQLLDSGPVRGARGLTELGELVLDGPALLDCEAAASLRLGFDRVATLGLFARGHADIDDRSTHAAFS